jgi:hypothetical protein
MHPERIINKAQTCKNLANPEEKSAQYVPMKLVLEGTYIDINVP